MWPAPCPVYRRLCAGEEGAWALSDATRLHWSFCGDVLLIPLVVAVTYWANGLAMLALKV